MSLPALHSLLLQTPLSQLNSVLSDIRGLLAPSNAQVTGASPGLSKEFEASLPSLLERFYEEQGKVVRLRGMEEGSIIAQEARDVSESGGSGSTYRDEAKTKRFQLDSVGGMATSADTYTVQSKDELRIELERALQGYLRQHYPDLDKSRTNEGACGAVWRGPLREVKIQKTEKPIEATPVQGAQEDKVMQDGTAETEQVRTEADNAEKSVEGNTAEGEEGASGSAAVVEPAASSTLVTEAPKAASEDAGADDEEEEGELIEEEGGEAAKYTIRIVSGKSNAANFWSGRLLSTYIYDTSSSTLTGSLKLQIHYYENGNVQLNTSSVSTELPLPTTFSASSTASQKAKAIIQTIKKYETDYQTGIEVTYEGLNERAFKNLRRQLPVTRQKVDWDKVLNYRLGTDLAGAQQAR
ncbi:subunits of heterodimeric actin filament capping protein Capz [Microstroma glucosiphilum]|uniref:F-actin-capping protein subunit alpha n=1 Tax=Pseudomicrostroma glucosiphilum TaxID=1684307 RepID=A0A316U3Y4_9BASI|nr:subunits of heterodimeric actin filament capping protein Capz [Pseudomicrostroma glucosiphilum]PWN19870.1 subunits of heterodimeric actin filament capping protein Capz [Pseudomicrostroma glucosiphilum]